MSKYQSYPRKNELLDEAQLIPHSIKLSPERLRTLIYSAIKAANSKSSQTILSIPQGATQEQLASIYKREGKKLLDYFKDYCVDPAATAHQVTSRSYRDVGNDLFIRRALQKERMNAGWRYQYLVIYCARETRRFESISDLGLAEADFSAKIGLLDKPDEFVNLYVSVKNRKNTIGGQDFPKAVQALEHIASTDKNRIGNYCCVFGIAMDRGAQQIRRDRQKKPHSQNTEVWLSDYFWPFFTNFTYEEIMMAVLEVLENWQEDDSLSTQLKAPDELLESFRAACTQHELINEAGIFEDSRKLVRFFCAP